MTAELKLTQEVQAVSIEMYALPPTTTTTATGGNNAKPADPADASSSEGTKTNSKPADPADASSSDGTKTNSKPADPADASSSEGTSNDSKTADPVEPPKTILTTDIPDEIMLFSASSTACVKLCAVILSSLLLWVWGDTFRMDL